MWAWAINALRMGSGLILLPLVVRYLSRPEFDMYFVFLAFWNLIPIVDFGFTHSFGRAIAYAMAGAQELLPNGYVPATDQRQPNYELLGRVLRATRWLYRVFAGAGMLVLTTGGTWLIYSGMRQTPSLPKTAVAWALMILAIGLEVYMAWWNNALQSMNRVSQSLRYAVLALALRLVLFAGLLVAGLGLLSVPISNIISSAVQRGLARRAVLALLPGGRLSAGHDPTTAREVLRVIWPNTWRTGVHLLGSYLATQANTILCLKLLGLNASGMYGFTFQLFNICMGVAYVWVQVKVPQITQLRVKQDYPTLRRLLRLRILLSHLTYWVMAALVIFVVPPALARFAPDKAVLASPWLELFALLRCLDMQLTISTTLIATGNRLPFYKVTVGGSIAGLLLAVVLATCTGLGVAAFVVAPLLVGLAYNYWKWTVVAIRDLSTAGPLPARSAGAVAEPPMA